MQEFDYSNETSNDLYDAVDGLSYEEAVFAKEAIEKIKEEKEEKKVMKFKKWFNEALFPILNEFAAVSGCCLKIDQDACGGMTVTLRSKYGVDITANQKQMHMAIAFADHIAVQKWSANAIAMCICFWFAVISTPYLLLTVTVIPPHASLSILR